jgi:putative lipoprotein
MNRLAGFLYVAAAVLAGCEVANDDAAPAAAEARLVGTVLYRERMALPADATVEVRLEDVSRADAPAEVLAEQTIATEDRQVPIAFELRYAAEAIRPDRRYGIRAVIRGPAGELLFTTTTPHAVLENGAPSQDIEIVLQRAANEPNLGAGAPSPVDDVLFGAWLLVTFQEASGLEEAVADGQRYTIEFTPDGRFSGQADCNRYFGGYMRPAPGRLEMSDVGTTLAACPPESRSTDFLRAIGTATRYELAGPELKLFGGGDVLTFVREPPPAADAAPEVGRTFVFDCADQVSFTVRTGPGEVALWLPESLGGAYLVLSATPAASGARYAEGDIVFWNRGELAMFEVGGQRYTDCRSNPAKVPWADAARRGAIFRGLGNEPGWNVEIERDGRIVLVTDYGARRTEVVDAEPVVAGARTTYRAVADADELTVLIERRACADTMSGEGFEATVTVTFAAQILYGCGRFL